MARTEYRTGLIIKSAERLNCSASGNPRWRVHFTDGSAHVTSSDASCNYDVPNYLTDPDKQGKRITIRITRAGRITRIRQEES